MLDKLIDLVIECWSALKPFEILRVYERGVRLRGGTYKETLVPGFYFKIPVYDDILTDNVVTRTSNTSNQLVTTADGKTVALRAVLRWCIRDIRKALLEVEGLDDATRDITYGVIEQAIKENTWERVRQPGFTEELTKRARKIGFRYGVEVEQLQFSDLSLTKSLTLNQN